MINHRTRECKLIFFDYVKVQARMGVHNFAHPPCKKIRQESVGRAVSSTQIARRLGLACHLIAPLDNPRYISYQNSEGRVHKYY
jgi:hypothetical protein